MSSLFNTTTFTTTHSEQKVTLDWILPDGKNSQLETLRDKHITDFPGPGGNTGAMLVYLPDLELFYNTKEFLVDLQSGELFVKLNNKWHPAGLMCEKRNFEVDGLMALIQHASIRLKNKIYGRKEDQMAVLILDTTEAQPLLLPFIPSVANYMLHSKPMSPAMRKKLYQGQGTSSSDVHNRVWQYCTLEPRKPGTFAQTDATLTSRGRQSGCSEKSSGRSDRK